MASHTWVILLGYGSRCSAMVHAARRRFTLLGNCSQLLDNSSWWSEHEFDCLALFTLARISSRWRCTTGTRCSGTSCGGYDPRYPWQTTWVRPQRWPSPQDEALRGTILVGAFRKTSRRYPEDTTRYVRICMISRFL